MENEMETAKKGRPSVNLAHGWPLVASGTIFHVLIDSSCYP